LREKKEVYKSAGFSTSSFKGATIISSPRATRGGGVRRAARKKIAKNSMAEFEKTSENQLNYLNEQTNDPLAFSLAMEATLTE
jgi:hypothetical protein